MSSGDNRGPAEQRLFEAMDRIAGRQVNLKWLDRLLAAFRTRQPGDPRDWQVSARIAMDEQKVLRARTLLYAVISIFAMLLLWSAFASLDEVTRGEGKVIPSRQLQIVQSVDGGVVEEIFVREGKMVAAGEVLIRIDPTRFIANLQEEKAKAFALRAKVGRLQALVNGTAYDGQMPEDTAAADGSEAELILAQERQYYFESRKQLDERLLMARQQLDQRRNELREVEAALQTAERSYRSAQDELNITRPLLSSGAVSEIDILRLEREVSRAQGERQQAHARRQQLLAGIQEAETRIRDVELTARNEWRAELTTAMAQLNSLGQNVTGLADRVKYSEIRSPVNGVVQRVLYNTIGGVVQPGHAVVEVVPTDDRLLIEAKIAPKDIAFLRPDLPAVIKFTAYDFAVYGGMQGTLKHISPDSVTDDKGNTFYLIRVETTQKQFRQSLPVIPGMTAQVDILTGKRTVLSYLLKPLLRARQNAMSER